MPINIIETYDGNGNLISIQEIETPPLTKEEVDAMRATAYREETDGLMAKYLAGEIEKEVWLAARSAVKQRITNKQ